MFKLNQFIITKLSDSAVVQNKMGIHYIKAESVIKLLFFIDENNIFNMSKDDIQAIVGSDMLDETISFLIEIGVFFVEKESFNELDFSKIGIYSNDELFLEKGLSVLEKGKYQLINNLENISMLDCVVIFLNPFNLKKFNELCQKMNDVATPVFFSFFYNHKIYITNCYKKEWAVPCPKCFFAHLEGTLRSEGRMYNIDTFQTVVDLIYFEKTNFDIISSFDSEQYLVFWGELIKFINKEPNIIVNRVVSIDVKNYVIDYDTPVFWELCDCIY